MTKSHLETIVFNRIILFALPEPEREYRFCEGRRFRFDFAWPEKKVAVEVEGGTWQMGRHTSGVGFQNDCRKYNLAIVLGWKVLRYTSGMIDEIVEDLKEVLY